MGVRAREGGRERWTGRQTDSRVGGIGGSGRGRQINAGVVRVASAHSLVSMAPKQKQMHQTCHVEGGVDEGGGRSKKV